MERGPKCLAVLIICLPCARLRGAVLSEGCRHVKLQGSSTVCSYASNGAELSMQAITYHALHAPQLWLRLIAVCASLVQDTYIKTLKAQKCQPHDPAPFGCSFRGCVLDALEIHFAMASLPGLSQISSSASQLRPGSNAVRAHRRRLKCPFQHV